MNITYTQFEQAILTESNLDINNLISKLIDVLNYNIPVDKFFTKIKQSRVLKILYAFFKFIKFSVEALVSVATLFMDSSYLLLKSFLRLQQKMVFYIKFGDKSFISLLRKTMETFGVEVIAFSFLVVFIEKLFTYSLPSIDDILSGLTAMLTSVGSTVEYTGDMFSNIYDFVLSLLSTGDGTFVQMLIDGASLLTSWKFLSIYILIYLVIAVYSLAKKRTKKKYKDPIY
jgi:hypothetical protein